MKPLKSVVYLSLAVGVLALFAVSVSLFWQDGGGTYTFMTLRGDPVVIYGQGLYRYDSLLVGAGNRGVDLVTMALGIPLLLFSIVLYGRGSLRGALLLTGIQAFFLYIYASFALGSAYNELYLVYVALFSASFFAIVLLLTSIPARDLFVNLSTRLPNRVIATIMFITAFFTLILWIEAPLSSLIHGGPPATLGHYTTLATHSLDLAIIVPSLLFSAVMILRRDPTGYLVAIPLLSILAMLAPALTAMTLRAR
ncbi:MAG: hypothetical protein Q7J85_10065 [Bacillota bacterium]|nr:hypothetical protein [Bacillota bacterium]